MAICLKRFFMTIAIVTLIVLASLLLILLVLAQDPKSGGFNSGFSPGQFMGVQKTTDLLEKITWGLAAAVFVFSISTNFMVDKGDGTQGINSVNIERARQSGGAAPAAPAPAQQPAQGQPAPAGQPVPAEQPATK